MATEVIPAETLEAWIADVCDKLQSADLGASMNECLPLLSEGFARNFLNQAGSTGGGWPARKRVGDGHELLNETGALAGATQVGGSGNVSETTGRTLAIGVDKSVRDGGIPGAAAHNFGYPDKNIPPQREFLYADDETLDRMAETIADGALEAVFGS
jgi:hypothetical protein